MNNAHAGGVLLCGSLVFPNLASLVACATGGSAIAPLPSHEQSLSRSAARAVVAHYLGEEWARQPYLKWEKEPTIRPITYNDITSLRSGTRSHRSPGVTIWGRAHDCKFFVDSGSIYWQSVNLTRQQTRDLAVALHALGAPLRN